MKRKILTFMGILALCLFPVSVQAQEYEMNAEHFAVPDNWILKEGADLSSGFVTFYAEGDSSSLFLIRIEDIPEVMTINASTMERYSDQEIAQNYLFSTVSENSSYKDIVEEWKTINDISFYERTFIYETDSDYKYGKEISAPVNDASEIVWLYAQVEDEELLTVVDDVFASIFGVELGEDSSAMSVTEQTYVAATTMTKADLDGSEGEWSYKGIPLVTEDCEWIDASWNTAGTVNQGAIYRKIAMILDGFDMHITNLLDYSELLTGKQISSRDEMAPYVENLQTFIICDEGPEIVAIMQKLEQNSFVSGTFDYSVRNLGRYSVDITDLKQCAAELNTSEEMLGYILGELSEYAPEITFGENSCHIEYQNTNEL